MLVGTFPNARNDVCMIYCHNKTGSSPKTYHFWPRQLALAPSPNRTFQRNSNTGRVGSGGWNPDSVFLSQGGRIWGPGCRFQVLTHMGGRVRGVGIQIPCCMHGEPGPGGGRVGGPVSRFLHCGGGWVGGHTPDLNFYTEGPRFLFTRNIDWAGGCGVATGGHGPIPNPGTHNFWRQGMSIQTWAGTPQGNTLERISFGSSVVQIRKLVPKAS